jgi:hypothetical protein
MVFTVCILSFRNIRHGNIAVHVRIIGQDEDQIKYVINHDLHELGDWSTRWLMSFNPDKTEIMLFKNVENSTNFNFYFDGILFPLTSDHKHLGITFNEEAKWNKHVETFDIKCF